MELPRWLYWFFQSQLGKRVQSILRLQLRQVPCLQAVLPTCRCLQRTQYQSLGQNEEDDCAEVEDKRQSTNEVFGGIMVKSSMVVVIALTAMMLARNNGMQGKKLDSLTEDQEFERDSPIVLYLAAFELLVCGACARTASVMYKRRKHALLHPAESSGRERARYIKVHLEKEPGLQEQQLYGLSFRPSNDGLECLFVEAIASGSPLDRWNHRVLAPSPEELVEEALGDFLGDGDGDATGSQVAEASGGEGGQAAPRRERVLPGAAILAVNEVSGDVGIMTLQLLKPKVTLWVRAGILEVLLSSQVDPSAEATEPSQQGDAAPPPAAAPGGAPMPTVLGRSEEGGWSLNAASSANPRCACLGLEDEEPQVLMRWTICALIFGWVTMLPVLLMQPHEERPRQQLFRQYLLKPCLIMMPISIIFWVVDCAEMFFGFELLRPFWYFSVCHMFVPGVLAFCLLRMQAADERLISEQRGARQEEAGGSTVPVVVEDPSPTLLKELIAINPVALIWLSCCAAAPLVLASLLTPMQSARGKLAQGYVHLIYTPCIVLQAGFAYAMFNLRFTELPQFYLAGLGLLLSLPCFLVWAVCLCCASHHGRQDLLLVKQQRLERARETLKRSPFGLAEASGAAAGAAPGAAAGTGAGQEPPSEALVDCSESYIREWDLVCSA